MGIIMNNVTLSLNKVKELKLCIAEWQWLIQDLFILIQLNLILPPFNRTVLIATQFVKYTKRLKLLNMQVAALHKKWSVNTVTHNK